MVCDEGWVSDSGGCEKKGRMKEGLGFQFG